jgi:hypothetical protein
MGLQEEVLTFEPPHRMTYAIVRGGGPIADHRGDVAFEPRDWRDRCRLAVPVPLTASPGWAGSCASASRGCSAGRCAASSAISDEGGAGRAATEPAGMIRGLLELIGGLGTPALRAPHGLGGVAGTLRRASPRRVAEVGNGRRAEFDAGVVAGLITQSSSAAAVRIVSFVNAGLMSLTQAVGVLVGANLGATVPAWLLALQPGSLAIGILGAGASVHLLADRETVRFGGALTMGAGMLFVAIGWLTRAWHGLGPHACRRGCSSPRPSA